MYRQPPAQPRPRSPRAPVSQPGSTPFFSRWCRQPVLLKTSVSGFNQSPCQALAPSFCSSWSSRRKIYYEHHFTPTSQTCWDSTIHEATTWRIFCSPPRSHKRRLLPAATKYLSATGLLCDPEPVTAPLWASSSSSMQPGSQRWSPRVISSQAAITLWFISTTGITQMSPPGVPTSGRPHPLMPMELPYHTSEHRVPQLQTSDGSLLSGLTFKALYSLASTSPSCFISCPYYPTPSLPPASSPPSKFASCLPDCANAIPSAWSDLSPFPLSACLLP